MIEKRFRVEDMKCRVAFRWSEPLQRARWFVYIDGKPVNEEGFETEEMALSGAYQATKQVKDRRSGVRS
jgi:hypothetical protein